MSNVRIERGFRIPLAEYRYLPSQLQERIPAAIAPYVRAKAAEIVSDLQDATRDEMYNYAVSQVAPRGYTPSRYTKYLLGKSLADNPLAISLLKDWAPYYMHPNQLWSSYDITVRIDLWMPRADSTGPDAEYVYGRLVTVPADEAYIALLGIPGVEEFSYFDRDSGAPEGWDDREPVWNNVVDEDSRTEWSFIPDELWLADVIEEKS